MRLLNSANQEVKFGDKLTDFRGDHAWFRSSREPAHSGKSGFVYVVERKSDLNNKSVMSREYYVNVFDLHWQRDEENDEIDRQEKREHNERRDYRSDENFTSLEDSAPNTGDYD